MNEFIKKLIEKLEERKTHLMKDFVLANVVFSSKQKALDRINEIDGAISIVNQFAEEYNNESVKTNADYIRNMTDEELINIISCQYGSCDNDYRNCDRCKLIWLKTEREG